MLCQYNSHTCGVQRAHGHATGHDKGAEAVPELLGCLAFLHLLEEQVPVEVSYLHWQRLAQRTDMFHSLRICTNVRRLMTCLHILLSLYRAFVDCSVRTLVKCSVRSNSFC